MSLKLKFLIPIFLIFVVFTVSSVYLADNFARKEYVARIKKELTDFFHTQLFEHFQANALREYNGPESTANFQHLFNLLKKQEIISIIFYLNDGTVIYSDNQNLTGEKFADVVFSDYYPEVFAGRTVEVLNPDLNSTGAKERGYARSMNVYVPINLKTGELFGFFEINFSLDELNAIMLRFQRAVAIFSSVFFLVLSFFVILFFRRKVEGPILRITEKMQETKKRNRNVRLSEENSREFNLLIGFINSLISRTAKAKDFFDSEIGGKNKEIKKIQEDLEIKLREKMDLAQARIGQLEQFKNVAISREERILELKNEVKRLKEILGEE